MLADTPLELKYMSNAPVIGNVSQNTTEETGMHFATLVLDALDSMGSTLLKSFFRNPFLLLDNLLNSASAHRDRAAKRPC